MDSIWYDRSTSSVQLQFIAPQAPASTHPGEGAEDAALIDAAVVRANMLYYIKGLETVRAIGEYLIAHFFAGDPANFYPHGRKHASLTAYPPARAPASCFRSLRPRSKPSRPP